MQNNKEFISTLHNCLISCEYCANACLSEENVKEMTDCIRIDRDCADICSLAIKFLARNSKYSRSIISNCATLCAECAEECEKHEQEHCIKCAKACRECEASCREYLNH